MLPILEPALRLTTAGCRARQARLRARLVELDAPAALIADRHHVHYFTGYWGHPNLPAVALILTTGQTILAKPGQTDDPTLAADVVLGYVGQRCSTMIEDRMAAAWELLRPHLPGGAQRRLACDLAPRPGLLAGFELLDLWATLLQLRRTKDADELALLRHVFAATETCYARARQVLQPGMTEIEMFSHLYAAAALAVGAPIGELGNDFQCRSIGGPPRDRVMRAGELLILDLGFCRRGYCSDMSRALAVNGQPTAIQLDAHARVCAALAHVEASVKPGVSCRELFEQVRQMLTVKEGWSYPHHLGHGVGLEPHEGPRLNPNWDDTFAVGDVFTAEPGLYGEELAFGMRLEQVYHLSATGLERLTSISLDL